MTKDNALNLAKLAIYKLIAASHATNPWHWRDARQDAVDASIAIDKALAEQPAQQEPVDSTQISKVWWDGERLMAKPIPFVEFYKPAQQEPVGDEWMPCMKLPVVVHVRKQRPGEAHVSTREGITPVKPDDLIMRGVSGEEYPIGRAIFEQTYSLETSPPAQQEPVQYKCTVVDNQHPSGVPLEQWAKPQRTWVGLTDKEEVELWESTDSDWELMKRTEAKLKEKNGI